MRFAILSSILGLAACAWADTVNVTVGQNGTLTFTPNSVTANNGDVIAFQFLTGNHSVTQSSFDDPCTRLTSPSPGIDSDFQPVAADATTIPQYSFTVTNASSPLWFYCRQSGHCKTGMVFAVNPTASDTYDAFKAKAMGASSTPSSTGSSSSGSLPSPSASNNGSYGNAALGLGLTKVAGIISLVAILAGSIL